MAVKLDFDTYEETTGEQLDIKGIVEVATAANYINMAINKMF